MQGFHIARGPFVHDDLIFGFFRLDVRRADLAAAGGFEVTVLASAASIATDRRFLSLIVERVVGVAVQ